MVENFSRVELHALLRIIRWWVHHHKIRDSANSFWSRPLHNSLDDPHQESQMACQTWRTSGYIHTHHPNMWLLRGNMVPHHREPPYLQPAKHRWENHRCSPHCSRCLKAFQVASWYTSTAASQTTRPAEATSRSVVSSKHHSSLHSPPLGASRSASSAEASGSAPKRTAAAPGCATRAGAASGRAQGGRRKPSHASELVLRRGVRKFRKAGAQMAHVHGFGKSMKDPFPLEGVL